MSRDSSPIEANFHVSAAGMLLEESDSHEQKHVEMDLNVISHWKKSLAG